MKFFYRNELKKYNLPGRIIQKAVGKDGESTSKKMTVGFANYSAASGPMEPHNHAEETVYIIDAHSGRIRFGSKKDQLGDPITLKPGMILHIPELEWHVFEYNKGGYVDIIFIYGQAVNIRPEEK
jgi:mannose-6-phosphate isomerase-like protein (cupin superfamily)